MKLKKTLFDKIFRKDRFKEIIYLRNQIDQMLNRFESLDIIDRLDNYYDVNSEIFRFNMTTLDEVRLYNDLGEKAVIDRLTKDRDKIISILKGVKDIDINDILSDIRKEKISKIINIYP